VSKQPRSSFVTRPLCAAGVALMLTGCNVFGSGEPAPIPPGCPPVHALIGADRVSSYRSPEAQADDLEYVAALNQVRSRCRTIDDGIEVDVAFELVVERGPALPSDPLRIGYFIATLAAPNDALIGKRVLPVELAFGDAELAGTTETVTFRLTGVDPASPPTRRLVVGLANGRQPAPRPDAGAALQP
jgi:hypothetical protein